MKLLASWSPDSSNTTVPAVVPAVPSSVVPKAWAMLAIVPPSGGSSAVTTVKLKGSILVVPAGIAPLVPAS